MVIPITQTSAILPPQKSDLSRNALSQKQVPKNGLKLQGKIQGELLKVLFSAIQDTASKYRIYTQSIDHHTIHMLLDEMAEGHDEVTQLAKLILLHQSLQHEIEETREERDEQADTDDVIAEKQATLLEIEEKIERLTIVATFKEKKALYEEKIPASDIAKSKEPSTQEKSDEEKLLEALLNFVQEKETSQKEATQKKETNEKQPEVDAPFSDPEPFQANKAPNEKEQLQHADKPQLSENVHELNEELTKQTNFTLSHDIKPLPVPNPIIASLFIPPCPLEEKAGDEDHPKKSGGKKKKKEKKQKKRHFRKILKRALFG